jgi:predicted RecA/RadA family phage recombinase
MKNYMLTGDSFQYTAPTAGVKGGDVIIVTANLFGVAANDATLGQSVTIWNGGKIFNLPAVTNASFALGDLLYWDDANNVLTKTSAGNTKIGVAVAAKLTAGNNCDIKLYMQP